MRFTQTFSVMAIAIFILAVSSHFLMREDPAEFNRRLGLMLAAASGG